MSAGYHDNTVNAQIYRVSRVEEFYGDINEAIRHGRLQAIVAELTYSVEDERRGKPNPSKIPFQGSPRGNLAAYRTSVEWYRRFCEGEQMLAVRNIPRIQNSNIPPRYETAERTTFADFDFHGTAVLRELLESSKYVSMAQAVASLAVFSHPDTVAQTRGRAIFPTVRDPNARGVFGKLGPHSVMFDDNKSPTDAFFWSNGLGARPADCQINHIYNLSMDVNAYTNLANICMTPAFLAKLTDTSEEIGNILRYRSLELYGWVPNGFDTPIRPPSYETLTWAPTLAVTADLKVAIAARMARKPKDRTVGVASKIGWLFGDSDQ